MKKALLSLVAIATITLSSFGQAPEGFKYQAVVRDAGNLILNNQAVGMRLTILQGSIGGTAIYTETFAPTTNAYGLVNLEIGTGMSTNDFTLIDWASGPYFIETAVDITGGVSYVVMGTSQLMSVPYALHAKTAESVINDQVDDADSDPTNEYNTGVALNGTSLEVTDAGGTLSQDLDGTFATDAELAALSVNDADSDPTNEYNTGVALNGTTLEVTDAGGILSQDLDGTFATDAELAALNVNDADSDPANEIQDISLVNSNLSISGGSTIDLSGIDTDTQLNETEVDDFVANNGYLTSVPSTTRSITITPGMIASSAFYSGASLGSVGGWLHPCITYPDGVISYVIVSVPTPSDWDGTSMSIKVLYASDGTTGDFQFSAASRGVLVGQSLSQGPGGGSFVLPVPTGVDILSEATGTNFGIQVTNQDVINLYLRRLGSSTNDTSTDVLNVVGFVIDYNTL
ncbi:MAG: hypothetical protein HRT58_02045 [Crocinitomicaceae bacterium]|nr:hypothetical protein [Crocinitomicaceae bacterium]